ncbi:MAG TPA: NAD(P)H-dependent oxidoreductase, partial [Solirubrobacteraceae bacterium]|nr:NAD(P)H-dependent oxidoreductase [Solirubrobacteraceae bacterium]
MRLFRLDASIREEGSHSREIADIVEQEWREAYPDGQVTNREIGVDPLPSDAWATAVAAKAVAEDARSAEQQRAVALAATLTDELEAADALLFAVPLYNFGVSQHFKTYVDLIVTDARMAAGAEPAIAAKPAVLATVHGGYYAAGTPREGWDHATGWMRRILADVWKLDLLVVEKDF